ncbi:MAG: GAF domain-containing sensor histidine kinase [Ardenticatenaceae bacterium]|nr:GAF domain-containing sensor histidine kinase [Anaerolineales bacterium]MCB8923427.1 GAF domain-containing sensor histidine kinase [Ardenticatenaceae bacterium]MCB8991418.1 GAF domain-containing sensor histidine kinase [Ardenticatenaceae bacterium]MCB9003848.1 GAF domain-containing sensor histidine kinase [Ardenticatenaceae bacterium]
MTKGIATITQKETRRFNWLLLTIFLLTAVIQAGAFYVVAGVMLNMPLRQWLPILAIATGILLLIVGIIYSLVAQSNERLNNSLRLFFKEETQHLQETNKRAYRLQQMASTLRATLSFERVVEAALDVCSLELEEMGTSRQSLVGAVFLYHGTELYPVATRGFIGTDDKKSIPGNAGVVGEALTNAEPTVTQDPRRDPELKSFATFQSCVTAVCIPLRAGFQIFGAMVIGSGKPVEFNRNHFELFNAVADQAVIALQNAQLYQQLTAEKQRLIEADEEARKELARDLHDGPTQSIAAIAMRINFIRSLVTKDPRQSLQELEKVEEIAKRTAKEIRGMLFTLRPLVLETQGLAAAIESVMGRIRETDGLNMRLVGGQYGDLLSESAQSVVFSIVEEALGNARKYSDAKVVEVRMWKEDDLFVARIQDDGIGFDTEDVNRDYSSRGSLGMVNMRERAERIEGSLRVESTPGKGTMVMLVVPLRKHGRHAQNGR